MKKSVGVLLLCLSFAVLDVLQLCGAWAGAPADANFTESVVVNDPTNLGNATGMAWAPDGSNRLFITRKDGQVRIVKNGALLATPFATISPVFTNNECGVIGMCFDPNFVVNRYVYFFVTVSNTEQQIIRYTDSNDTGINKTVILANLPTVGENHDGGAVGFGPDGKLYWAIGDQGNGTGVDADLTSLASKIGRANPDGTVPLDNPFFDNAGTNNDYIWARGFRNPFTFAFQPKTGKLWVNDVGTLYEQCFIVNRGDHAGWNDYENNQPAGFITPVIVYRTNGTDTRMIAANGAVRNGNVVTFTTTAAHGFRKGGKITVSGVGTTSFNGSFYVASVTGTNSFIVNQAGPNETSGGGSAVTQNLGGAMTGGTFYDSTSWPAAYQGNFFFGDYRSHRIMRATLDANNEVTSVDYFVSGVTLCVDMAVGPDGALYYIGVLNGILYRLAYNGAEQNLIVSPTGLNMSENGTAVFTVRLAQAPASTLTVSIIRTAGDSDVTVTSGATLTFTPTNYATLQSVTLTAAEDADSVNDAATFSVSASGLTTQEVCVNVVDNEPSNDQCAGAIALTNGVTMTMSTAAAMSTGDPEPTCEDNFGKGVWFSFTPAADGLVTISTDGSSFDTVLQVFTGSCATLTAHYAGCDNDGGEGARSLVKLNGVGGVTYRILAGGRAGASGTLHIRATLGGMPDLITWGPSINPQITEQTFPPGYCAIVDGCIVAGTRRLIRFTTEARNVGSADLAVGDPTNNPLFYFNPCRSRFHFAGFAQHELLNGSGSLVAGGNKVSFCITESTAWDAGAPTRRYNCSFQGIQPGWADIYGPTLDCQWVDITGVAGGTYTLRVTVNPDQLLPESNFNNNTASVSVFIPFTPANDLCVGAIPISSGATVTTNTSTATTGGDPSVDCGTLTKGLWYLFTPPCSGTVTVRTCGSDFDTMLAVFTGTCATLTQIACNEDSCGQQSSLSFFATSGTTYRILAGGYNGASGTLRLLVTGPSCVDLAISGVTITPSSGSSGTPGTLCVTIRNGGKSTANNFTLSTWVNRWSSASCGMTGDFNQLVPSLGAGASMTVCYSFTFSGATGNRKVITFADSQCVVDEASETNNQKSALYSVFQPPDLAVISLSVAPASGPPGTSATLTVSIKNGGKSDAANFRLDVWHSIWSSRPCGQTGDNTQNIPLLAKGATATFSFPVMFGGAPGNRKAIVFADSQCVVNEASETNNQKSFLYTVTPISSTEVENSGTPTSP